jgi:hypothetical protein
MFPTSIIPASHTSANILLYETSVPIIEGIVALKQDERTYYHHEFLRFSDCEFNFHKTQNDDEHDNLALQQRQCVWYLEDLQKQALEHINIPHQSLISKLEEEKPLYDFVCKELERAFPSEFNPYNPHAKMLRLENPRLVFIPIKKEENSIRFKREIEINHLRLTDKERLRQILFQHALFQQNPENLEKCLSFWDY